MIYILLGTGFEPIEAVAPCDILRRGGADVKYAGIGGKTIVGGHGITLTADCTADEIRAEDGEMIVLPGGMGGVRSILGSESALSAIREFWQRGKFVAAICAGPTVLAKLGITDGKKATCYPGMEDEMGSALMQNAACVRDGNLITGRAAGASFEFGLALLTAVKGEQTAKKVAKGIVYG
jgi:4-methyl-5(b-hydroxyethyl)-thiazole monophosphate biosynthesis